MASASIPSDSPLHSRFATPLIVKTVLFQVISSLLCLSTLACTFDRVAKWRRSRRLEFEKERAFSFSVTNSFAQTPEQLRGKVENFLCSGRWEISCENNGDLTLISGQKGMSGFWGSVVFHAGLVLCFLAVPVTALTGFSGAMTVTGDIALPLRSAVVAGEGYDAAALPDAQVQVSRLRGEFFQGQYRHDFGGELLLSGPLGEKRLPFAVNSPATFSGYQFSLSEYGNAPRLVLEKEGGTVFDYYLNLTHPEQGDYFELEPGLSAQVIFFPDFIRQGDKIGSRSRRPDNPVTLVRILRGEQEVFKGLFKPGDQEVWEGTRISVPDYRHCVTLVVSKEHGVLLVILGSLLGAAGLLARFLSNERRIEFELSGGGETGCRVRGYSRYYPAFLEKEVLEIARGLADAEPARYAAEPAAAGGEVS